MLGLLGLSLLTKIVVSAPDADRNARVVARVGESSILVGGLERRLAELSGVELDELGGPAEAPRRLLEQILIPELSAELEARARGLDQGPRFADRNREILGQAIDRALRVEASTPAVTEKEIAEFFEKNREQFDEPARIRIWRIVVDDERAAQEILEKVKGAGDPRTWSDLARERSVDTATRMRQGDLGFVRADGSTDVARVRVAPALYQAAEGLKDGEILPRPLPVSGRFAVLWRRGSRPEKKWMLQEARDSIKKHLERRRVEEAKKRLVSSLRKRHVRIERPELLELVPEGLLNESPVQSVSAQGSSGPSRAGSEPPRPSARGLR